MIIAARVYVIFMESVMGKNECDHKSVYESVGHDLFVKCAACGEVSLANNWAKDEWEKV